MASESYASLSPMRIKKSTFQFEVDYSKLKHFPTGAHITSPTFAAGGYDWALHYYPQGDESVNERSYVSLFLSLESEAEDITAGYSFQLLDTEGMFITIGGAEIYTFSSYKRTRGFEEFISRDAIEDHYCNNGFLAISCNIAVLTEPRVVGTYPGGLCEHMKKFFDKGERYDVTFEVEGESISAHRFMLAARSPVFEAELFGPMAEAKTESIKIDEMKAEVFKALLHFIYTDQLAKDGSSDPEILS